MEIDPHLERFPMCVRARPYICRVMDGNEGMAFSDESIAIPKTFKLSTVRVF